MKKFLAILLTLAMVFTLVACGVSTETETPASSGEATEVAAGGIRLFNGKIEIAEPLNHAAEVYEAATGKHVEVESLGGGVDLQATLKQYYQAGNMPDIFVFEGAPDLANWTGMVVDMSDQDWAKDTDAGFTSEDGLVGFPYTTEAIGLAYNKSILEAAGVDPASITGPESMMPRRTSWASPPSSATAPTPPSCTGPPASTCSASIWMPVWIVTTPLTSI